MNELISKLRQHCDEVRRDCDNLPIVVLRLFDDITTAIESLEDKSSRWYFRGLSDALDDKEPRPTDDHYWPYVRGYASVTGDMARFTGP